MFECASGAIALTVLDTIAASMKGTRRAALFAVKSWVEGNTSEPANAEELSRIFEETLRLIPAQQKGRDWWDRGCKKIDGEFIPTEPEDGAEWTCIYNAKKKRWEPPYPPPLVELQ
jgi:hypothetical protein